MSSLKECLVALCISPYLVLSVATTACSDSVGYTDIYSYVPTPVNMPSVQEEVPSVISAGTIADPTLPWFQVPYAPVSMDTKQSPPMPANSGSSVKTAVAHTERAPAVVSAAAASAVVVGDSVTTGLLASSIQPRKTPKSSRQEASPQFDTKVATRKESHITYQVPHYIYPPGSTAVHYFPPPPLVAPLPPDSPPFPPHVHTLQRVAEVTHHLVHVPGHVVLNPAPSVVAVAAHAAIVAGPPPAKPPTKAPPAKAENMVNMNGYHSNSFTGVHVPRVIQIAPPPVLVNRPARPPKPSPRPVRTEATRKVPQNHPFSPILFFPSPTIVNVNVHQAPVITRDHKPTSTRAPGKISVQNATVKVLSRPLFPTIHVKNNATKVTPLPLPVTRVPTLKPTARPATKSPTNKVPQSTPSRFVPATSLRPIERTLPPPPKTKRPTTQKVTTRPPITKRTIKVTLMPSTAQPTSISVTKRNVTQTPKNRVTSKPISSSLAFPPPKSSGTPTLVHVAMDRRASAKSQALSEQRTVQGTPTVVQVGMTRKGGVVTGMPTETTVQRTPTLVQFGMTRKGSIQSGILEQSPQQGTHTLVQLGMSGKGAAQSTIIKESTVQGAPTMVRFGMTRKGDVQSGVLQGSSLQDSATVFRMHSPENGTIHSGVFEGSVLNETLNISGNVSRSSPVMIAQPPTILNFGTKEIRRNVSSLAVDLPQRPPLLFPPSGGNSAAVTTKLSAAAKPATQVGMNPEIFKLAAELTSTALAHAMQAAGAAASAASVGHPLGPPTDIVA